MDAKIILTISASIVVIVTAIFFLILKVIYNRRVKKIAEYIFNELKDVRRIEDAKGYVALYETTLKKLKKEVDAKEKLYQEEAEKKGLINFGHKRRMEEYAKELENAKTERDSYEIHNVKQYEESLSLLKHVEIDFYDQNVAAVKDKLKKIAKEDFNKKDLENKKIQELQNLAKQKQLELIQKQRTEKDKLLEQKNRGDKVRKAIKDIEDFIPVLKNYVIENHSLNAHSLKILRDAFDSIEDNIDYINPKDVNNIKRIKVLLVEDIFAKDLTNNFDIEKKMIIDSLAKIVESVEQ